MSLLDRLKSLFTASPPIREQASSGTKVPYKNGLYAGPYQENPGQAQPKVVPTTSYQNAGGEASAKAPVDTSYAYTARRGARDDRGPAAKALDLAMGTGEGTVARAIARVLPGGTADLDANNKMAEESSQRVQNIQSSLKAGKISREQAKYLLQFEVNNADEAVFNQRNIEAGLPTRTQIGIGAAQTAVDAASGGVLSVAGQPVNRAAQIGVDSATNAVLGGAQSAAGGGDFKANAISALVGGSVPAILGGGSAIVSKIATRTNVPQEIVEHVINSGDKNAIKALADEAKLTPEELKTVAKTKPTVDTTSNAPVTTPPQAPLEAPTAPAPANPQAAPAALPAPEASVPRPVVPAEAQPAAQQVIASLKDATKNYNEIAATRSQEKAGRVSTLNDAYQKNGGGVEGVKAKLGQLKGEYSSKQMPPVDIPDDIKTALHDSIENSNLKPFEKLNTQTALGKLTGDFDGHLRPSDIEYLRKAFGDEFAATAKEAADAVPKSSISKAQDVFDNVTGLPRALMSTLDFSFGGRQGLVLGARYPKEWVNANKDSIRYAFDPGFFDKSMKDIANSPEYTTIQDQMKVALPGIEEDAKQLEHYAGANYAERIPVAGKAVQGSDRAYNGGLTKLRFDTAKKIIDSYGGTDEFLKFFDSNPQAVKDLGEFINTASGRGGKAGGLLDKYGKLLSHGLFSPRLWASRLQTLNPQYYARLDPVARKLALQTAGSFAATAGTVLAIAASVKGVDVEWDPRSADFAKIKVGNTRYDILGGLQQNIRTAAQVVTGEKINSETGEIQTLGPDRGYGKPSRKDIIEQAFENKENPLLAFASKLLQGDDGAGNKVNPVTEGAKLFIPLNAQGIYETAQDSGSVTDPKNVASAALKNIPSVFGIGTQTYGKTKTKDQNTSAAGVTDQIKQNTNDKTKIKADFVSSLTKDQQSLIKQSDKSLQKLRDEGTIDNDTYKNITALRKVQSNIVDGVKARDGIKNTDAKAFYEKYDSLTKDGQESYLNASPDSHAKAITDSLNKTLPDGMDKLTASAKLAKLYADYEIKSSKTTSAVDKNADAKKFYTDALKLNYDSDVNDVFSKGGTADIKGLVADGSITADQLDRAVELDDKLFNAGLTGSLKFSKAFRKDYGYKLPAGNARAGTSTSTSSSSSSTPKVVNAHLSDLLSSVKVPGTKLPRFNASDRKRVTVKLPNLPSAPSKPRISIKL